MVETPDASQKKLLTQSSCMHTTGNAIYDSLKPGTAVPSPETGRGCTEGRYDIDFEPV